jgi:hypothetical protein
MDHKAPRVPFCVSETVVSGLALYRLMYNNAETDFVCLARKKVIFDRAIHTLYGL